MFVLCTLKTIETNEHEKFDGVILCGKKAVIKMSKKKQRRKSASIGLYYQVTYGLRTSYEMTPQRNLEYREGEEGDL